MPRKSAVGPLIATTATYSGAVSTGDLTVTGKLKGANASTPSAAAGANAGTTPPAPVVAASATDTAGNITFGTGSSGGLALGEQVVVTFGATQGTVPRVITVVAGNAATGLKIPCVTAKSATAFSIGLAVVPTASQANTVYSVDYLVVV